MLKIWGRRNSAHTQRVLWLCEEASLPYELILSSATMGPDGHISGGGSAFGVVDTPAYRAMNPNGTVPTVIDGDNPPLWETGAILRYLAGKYGSDAFWPKDPYARANVDRWAEWSKINIASNYTAPVFWRTVRTAPSRRDPAAIDDALRKLGEFLDVAETHLAHQRYLADDHFTLADIQFGHCLYRYFDIDIDRADRPNLRRYYETLADRPAYREHVMISYEELRVTD